jgi:FMN phosphatase YigB (HAD superfamily)
MVVGDNFGSDILPPIEVGCKNAVYLKRYSKSIAKNYKFDESVQIIEIKQIGDILNISS